MLMLMLLLLLVLAGDARGGSRHQWASSLNGTKQATSNLHLPTAAAAAAAAVCLPACLLLLPAAAAAAACCCCCCCLQVMSGEALGTKGLPLWMAQTDI
jgi:hypothetical protein